MPQYKQEVGMNKFLLLEGRGGSILCPLSQVELMCTELTSRKVSECFLWPHMFTSGDCI